MIRSRGRQIVGTQYCLIVERQSGAKRTRIASVELEKSERLKVDCVRAEDMGISGSVLR